MKTKLCTALTTTLAVLSLSSCGVDWNSLASGVLEAAMTDYSNQSTEQEYDENGVPIYGYDGDNAVYGYDSNNQPIYDTALLATAVRVPNWEPKASAPVIYPARARRVAAPPPQARRHAPLKHRNPVSHGPRRPDRAAPQAPHHPRMSGPGPRPDRAAPPSRNPHAFGPGSRPDSNRQMQPGQRPGRMAPGPQHGRPNAGPGPDRQKGKPATSNPTAPAGVKVAPVPTTPTAPAGGVKVAPVPTAIANPASSGGYV